MGCSLFLDKMVEEPPAPKLQKPQQILACVFFDMFPFFCWLPSQSLTFDSWCISSCHMCCLKLWILARCPQCLGLRRQVAMPMPGWCCFFLYCPWFHGVPRLVWFCVPRSFVQASAEHRGRIQRSQSSRKALWEVKITATNLSIATWLQQTPVPPGHAESATGALRADKKCQWRNTKKIQKWLAGVWARFAPRRVFQGLHRLAQVAQVSWSFQSSCKAHVKPMWSPINPQPYVKCVCGSARGRHVVDQKPEGGATGMRGCGLTSGSSSSIMSILIVVIIIMNHNEHYHCHYNYHAIVIIRLFLSYYHCVSSFSNILNIICISRYHCQASGKRRQADWDPPWMVLWPPQIESWCHWACNTLLWTRRSPLMVLMDEDSWDAVWHPVPHVTNAKGGQMEGAGLKVMTSGHTLTI